MVKKIIAVLCIPVILLLATSIPTATIQAFHKMDPSGTSGYRFGYVAGLVLCAGLSTVGLLLWCRWIFRTLRGSRTEKN